MGVHSVLLLGSGKIGRMIARLLVATDDYSVRVACADCIGGRIH
jgi:saccharopine dehydrogenase-like NADP-dependent oxidoreductase